jgi:hypothetical protein
MLSAKASTSVWNDALMISFAISNRRLPPDSGL